MPIWDAGDKTTQVIPADVLRPGVTYYWRVQYWDSEYTASPWSDERAFTVEPIPGEVLYREDFDAVRNPDIATDEEIQESLKEWSGSLSTSRWTVFSLGVNQLLGDRPVQTRELLSQLADASPAALESIDTNDTRTEPDGRGHHGRFRGNVLTNEDGEEAPLITPVIDNSASGRPLVLVFDAQIRCSNDYVALTVEMLDGEDPDTAEAHEIYIWFNEAGVLHGRTDPVIYTISPTIRVDAAAHKKVRFRFWSTEMNTHQDYITLDNIEVIRAES